MSMSVLENKVATAFRMITEVRDRSKEVKSTRSKRLREN
jgi:hypothetical protein